MLLKDLQNAGLNENEAKVYLAALELGETNITRLAKKAGIKRTTTYLVVDSLKEKGLLSSTKRKNKSVLYAEDPRKIGATLKEKEKTIQNIMPELLALANFLDKKPKIRFFEGKEAFKEIFKDTLQYPDSEMLAWFAEDFTRFDSDFFLKSYIPKRIQKKIWVRAIFPDNPIMRNFAKNDEIHLRRSKFVASNKFQIQIEVNLYGNGKIGLISYDEELAIIVESQKIYGTLKSIFETMWEMLDYKQNRPL